ncbi:MAG: hypothetical protein WCT05_10420, partial [Lentisphaeria bacterium]
MTFICLFNLYKTDNPLLKRSFQPGVCIFPFLILFSLLTVCSCVLPGQNACQFPQSHAIVQSVFNQGTSVTDQEHNFAQLWIDKNDLQENQLRRVEENNFLFALETPDWPISKVILADARPALPLLKEICFHCLSIRAGPD